MSYQQYNWMCHILVDETIPIQHLGTCTQEVFGVWPSHLAYQLSDIVSWGRHLHFKLNFGYLLCLFNLLEGWKCSYCDNTIESHNVSSLEHVGIHQIIIICFLYLYIYETGHFPSIHHRGTVCLQMFDARPYGRVKRLKISDIEISHQPSQIFPSLSDFSRLLTIFINPPVGPG